MNRNVRHVAFFVHTLDDRAVSRLSVALAGEMVHRGLEVTLVSATRAPDFAGVPPPGIRLVDLAIGGRRTMFAVPRMTGWLRRARPDAVFAQGDGPGRASVLARALARVPTAVVVVLHRHHATFLGPGGRPRRWRRAREALSRRLFPLADLVAGVSPGVVEDAARRYPGVRGRTAVLPNPGPSAGTLAERGQAPVDHPWLAADRNHRTIVSVANVIRRKGQDLLVEALPEMVDRAGDVRLVLLGRFDEPDFRADLEQLARRLGVPDRIAMVGYRPDAVPWIARADAFALASRNEGLPLVLIEAMACGTPVVATDCPSGPAWLLEGGAAGRLAPMDDPPALADALVEVLTDVPLRDRLVARGRERARDFEPERAAAAWLEVAARAVARRQAAGRGASADTP